MLFFQVKIFAQHSNILTQKELISNLHLNKYDQKIYFTQNNGQWPASVKYKADFALGQAIATKEGMLVGTFDPASINAVNKKIEDNEKATAEHRVVTKDAKSNIKGHGWLMKFLNSSPSMNIESVDAYADNSNYFLGSNKSTYATDVKSYQEIWYKNVYPSVDVRYYPSASGSLEYDIVCKPGFNKDNIFMEYQGINKIVVNTKGELILNTSVGDVSFPKPIAYQTISGKHILIDAEYIVSKNNIVQFKLGKYNEKVALIIDPIALRWATWITNNTSTKSHGHGIWVDSTDGAIYVTGFVNSTGLITVNAFQNTSGGGQDIFIAKYYEPTTIGGSGTRVWQTYFGGDNSDNPSAIEQGDDGNLYIVGNTSSSNFPMLTGTAFAGTSVNDIAEAGDNIFITKINKAGTSTKTAIVGGNNNEDARDVRINAAGEIIVTGSTQSSNLGTKYPTQGAVDRTNVRLDVLIFKITQNLDNIIWMHNYGGNKSDEGKILLCNKGTGDIFLAGYTNSTNFPVLMPRQSILSGNSDGFFQKFNDAGILQWSSYFNAQRKAGCTILCMDFNTSKDSIYFGGLTTGLMPSNISASGVLSSSINGGQDFFVGRIGINQGLGPVTYLGGSLDESNMMGLAVDNFNEVYIFGYTDSDDFLVTTDALQSANAGGSDKTFSKLSSDLSTLKYSTYYGGSQDETDPYGERGIKFSNCHIYTIVSSLSANLPLTQGAITTTKLSDATVSEPGLVVWANPPDVINNNIAANQEFCGGTIPNDITGSLPIYSLPVISRDNVTLPHPPIIFANTYQWQKSTDSINWINIVGQIGQNITGKVIGAISQTTYIRRNVNGDICRVDGANDVILKVVPTTAPVVTTVVQSTCLSSANSIQFKGLPTTGTWTLTRNPGKIDTTGTGATFTLTNIPTGTFTFTVTSSAGCVSPASTSVQIQTNGVSIPIIQSTLQPTCNLNTGSVTFNNLPKGDWSINVNNSTIPISKNSTASATIGGLAVGNYVFTVTDSAGCVSGNTDTVKILAQPTINILTHDTTVCSGDTVVVNASGGVAGSYNWTPNNSIINTVNGTAKLIPFVTTKYYVIANNNNGCSEKDSITITVNALPFIKTINDTSLCGKNSVELMSTAGLLSYHWSPATGLSSTSINNPIANITATTQYIVSSKDANGCVAKDTVVITINPTPIITINKDTGICPNSTAKLMASGGSTYAWTPAENLNNATAPSPIASPSATTKYYVTATSAVGCTNNDSVLVTVNPTPIITINKDTGICPNTTAKLMASGGSTYTWTPAASLNNATASSTIASPSATTKYYLTATSAVGCTNKDSVLVTVNPTPIITVNKDTGICPNTTAKLMASGGSTYTWTPAASLNNATASSPIASPSATTKYYVTATSADGCTNNDSVLVTINPTPIITVNKDTGICPNSTAKLMASGGSTYAWTPAASLNNATASSTIASPSATTKYYVTATSAFGCTNNDSVLVTVNPTPIITVNKDTGICPNTTAKLMASGGSTYTWTPAASLNNATAPSPIASPSATTKYYVTATSADGCTNNDSVLVTINPTPIITISKDTGICPNTTAKLMASGGSTYTWTPAASLNNATAPSPIASPSATTKYYVTATSSFGCTNNDSVLVTVYAKQSYSVSPSVEICEKGSTYLKATGDIGDTYLWTPSTGLNFTNIPNPIATPKTTTQYWVNIVSKTCKTSVNLPTIVTIQKNQILHLSKSNDINCFTQTARLFATSSSNNITYSWTPSAGLNATNIYNPTATITTPRQYFVTATSELGCITTDSITINTQFDPLNKLDIPNAFTPNGDGLNDCFRAKIGGAISEYQLSIFNRYGERVFYTENPTDCWDGTFKGRLALSDNYVYYIVAKTSCGNFHRKGNLVLVQ